MNQNQKKVKQESKKTRTPQKKQNTVQRKTQTATQQKKLPEPAKKHSSRLMTALLVRIVTIIMLCLVIFGGGFFFLKKITEVKVEKHHAMVERQLLYCQELVTSKSRYSDIITIKKANGMAKAYSIIKYTGIVRAGIPDIMDIGYTISRDGRKITLNLPEAQLLGNEILQQEVFDEKRSIFVPITTQEIFDEIELAKTEVENNLIEDGFLEEARQNAIKTLRQFMLACGFDQIIIK